MAASKLSPPALEMNTFCAAPIWGGTGAGAASFAFCALNTGDKPKIANIAKKACNLTSLTIIPPVGTQLGSRTRHHNANSRFPDESLRLVTLTVGRVLLKLYGPGTQRIIRSGLAGGNTAYPSLGLGGGAATAAGRRYVPRSLFRRY